MGWAWRGLLLAITVLIVPGAAAWAQAPVTLLPHTSEAYGYEVVVPEGWTDMGTGIFARQADTDDPTLIALQSVPLPADEVLASLLPQLRLSEPPESVGTHTGAALEWTLYQVDVTHGEATVAVDLALAEAGGVTYITFLQTRPEEQETLYEAVFLPTLDAFAPLVEEQVDVPYQVEEVTVKNGDIALAGTLTTPPGRGPHPGIVLVSGSGPQNRDESLGAGIAIKPFRLLADALTRAGVAVLRYDDRGVGQSTGTFSEATVQDFASDAEAAITYLASGEEIDPDQLGLLGHSEGGQVAAMLGARNDELDFIISLAGPGVNGRDVLLLQNRRILEAEGATQEQIEAQVAFLEEAMTLLDDPEALETLIYEHTLEQAQAMPEEEREAFGDLEEYARAVAEQSIAQFTADWFASFLNYDPAPDWAQTTVPVLAIFGGKDVQVDAEQNAPPLAAALAEAGNDDYQITVLPNANHLFQRAETGSPTEYATLPAEFTPDLTPTILNWLRVQGITAGGPTATPAAAASTPEAPAMATPVA